MMQEFFPVLDAVPLGDVWVLTAWGALILTVWMGLLWAWHLRLQNASLADFGWAAGVAFLGLFYAIKADGYGPRRLLVALMALGWGGRLAFELFVNRIRPGLEDPYYTARRENWRILPGLRFFVLFLLQAFFATALSLPFALLVTDPYPTISGYEWAGLALWIVAMTGGVVSEAELKRFYENPDNEGQTCRDGLWRYSRYPHYFFGWLAWAAFSIAALGAPFGWIGAAGALLMLGFLRRTTAL